MSWYKQLRWRLIFTQLIAIAVGIGIVLLATRLIIIGSAPDNIRPHLVSLTEMPERLEQVEADLLLTFRNAVLLSVVIASVVAIATSIMSSMVLWRNIIFPLRQISGKQPPYR